MGKQLAEKYKKAAEADDKRAKKAEERMEYHQAELTRKEDELKEAMAILEKEQAEADRAGSMVGYSEGEIDDDEEEGDDEVEGVLSGHRAYENRNVQGKKKTSAAGDTDELDKEAAAEEEDLEEEEESDDDDYDELSPMKKVKEEVLSGHDMNYENENDASYENGDEDDKMQAV